MEFITTIYKKYPTTTVLTTSLSAYALYYSLCVAQRPKLFCTKSLRECLFREMPVLSAPYKPPFWCYGAIGQTLMRVLLKSCPSIPFRKEFLTLSDGGHVALDWVDNEDSIHYRNSTTRPTVILLPGLIGSSKESYILHFIKQSTQLGYRCVVFNNRGNGGAELKTPRTYCASNTDDLCEVITHVKSILPDSPLIAAGVSLGGIIVANYLANMGKDTDLKAAFTVSSAWNLGESTKTLEQPVNHFLFNSYLCNGLKSNVQKNRHLFADMDLDHLMKSTRIRDFDDRFIAKQFGYASWKEYYEDASMCHKVDRVQIPLLTLNAADDPFAPQHSLPCDEVEKTSHVAMVVTKYGGHIGFLEGTLPISTGFVDRLFAEYISAVFEQRLTDFPNNTALHEDS